jgi:hypothetical protein
VLSGGFALIKQFLTFLSRPSSEKDLIRFLARRSPEDPVSIHLGELLTKASGIA